MHVRVAHSSLVLGLLQVLTDLFDERAKELASD